MISTKNYSSGPQHVYISSTMCIPILLWRITNIIICIPLSQSHLDLSNIIVPPNNRPKEAPRRLLKRTLPSPIHPLRQLPPSHPLTSPFWSQFRARSPFATPIRLIYTTTRIPVTTLGAILHLLLDGEELERTVCTLNPKIRPLHKNPWGTLEEPPLLPRPRSQDPPSSTSSKHR